MRRWLRQWSSKVRHERQLKGSRVRVPPLFVFRKRLIRTGDACRGGIEEPPEGETLLHGENLHYNKKKNILIQLKKIWIKIFIETFFCFDIFCNWECNHMSESKWLKSVTPKKFAKHIFNLAEIIFQNYFLQPKILQLIEYFAPSSIRMHTLRLVT